MAIVLYVVGALGLAAAIAIGALDALRHLSAANITLAIIAAVIAVLTIGFGHAVALLQSIDRRLRQENEAQSAPTNELRSLVVRKDEPQRFRYGDFRIDAFDDGTYVVRGPEMKPTRFRNQAALDAFLEERA